MMKKNALKVALWLKFTQVGSDALRISVPAAYHLLLTQDTMCKDVSRRDTFKKINWRDDLIEVEIKPPAPFGIES